MPGLEAAKAYAALVGAIVTALLGVFTADTTVGKVLTVIAVIATAVTTYQTPNHSSTRPGTTTPLPPAVTQGRRGH